MKMIHLPAEAIDPLIDGLMLGGRACLPLIDLLRIERQKQLASAPASNEPSIDGKNTKDEKIDPNDKDAG